MAYQFITGDSYEKLKEIPNNSLDAIITDSPYGLGKEPDPVKMLTAWLEHGYLPVGGGGFMGKKWDAFVPQPLFWKECFRVLKPGGFLLSFFGTRTYDWGAMAIRLAGFQIRDQIQWIYGSGFPKSMNVSKEMDKKEGVEREVIGKKEMPDMRGGSYNADHVADRERLDYEITVATGDNAKKWEGYGTALKPANEPICVAQKPICEKNIIENILKWGTGGINIDKGRVAYLNDTDFKAATYGTGIDFTGGNFGGGNGIQTEEKNITANPEGRFPANVVMDEEAGYILDQQSGILTTGSKRPHHTRKNGYGNDIEANTYAGNWKAKPECYDGDSGGASRFFYCAKASAEERRDYNTHPTVKPIALMRWLVRIYCPQGGTVLDPFVGSGGTIIAAEAEGLNSIGIDLDGGNIEIAERRVTDWRNEAMYGKDYNPDQLTLNFE